MNLTEADIFAIERPHRRLWYLYLIRSILSGPFIVFVLPMYYFRYHTMRFRFDDEGIHMRWGILFRHQINLTYARIQDIHLTTGILQRWLILADIKIQTASGSASAEMTIEGLLEYEAIRTFLYSRMRGYQDARRGIAAGGVAGSAPGAALASDAEVVGLLGEILAELRQAREALERPRGEADGDV